MHKLRFIPILRSIARNGYTDTPYTNKVRKVYNKGKSYLVAPATLIVPGVLSGSAGPLLYPEDEVKRNVNAWNGMPLTLGHPYRNNEPASAREHWVWDELGVGVVKNTSYSANKEGVWRLAAEAWFDEELTKRKSPELHNRLLNNEVIELSTGLFTDDEYEEGVDSKGRQYTAIARNYRPDHVAILLNQRGACSISDGCGVLANSYIPDRVFLKYQKQIEFLRILKRNLNYLGDNMNKEQLVKWLTTNCECWKGATDNEILNNMDENKLKQLKDSAEKSKVNAALATTTLEAFEFELPKDKSLDETVSLLKDKIVSNMKVDDPDDDDDDTNDKTKVNKDKKSKNDDNNKDKTTTDTTKANKMTKEEVYALLDPEDKENLEFARKAKVNKKNQLISHIVSNLSDDEKKTVSNKIKNKSIDELELMASLVKKPEVKDNKKTDDEDDLDPTWNLPNYTGNAGGSGNDNNVLDTDDVYVTPKMNLEGCASPLLLKSIGKKN